MKGVGLPLHSLLLWITVWITQKLFTFFFICGLYNFGCCGKMKGFQLFVFNFSTLFVAECYKLCIFAAGKTMLWISGLRR